MREHLDFSNSGFPIGPFEPTIDAALAQESSPLQVLVSFFRTHLKPDARVLLFEPTQPDIRAAIVHSGASYVDAGRYLDGRLDDAAARCALKGGITLTLLNHDDEIPVDWPTPFMIDRRGQPFSEQEREGDWCLYNLGTRDGLSETRATWIAQRGEAPAGEISPDLFPRGFDARASQRITQQRARLHAMATEARSCGFEAHVQAGFLWFGSPGLSALELSDSFAKQGIGVFACDHHPYRHRVRIGVSNDRHTQQLFDCWSAMASTYGLNT